jgi:hypothetical protein
MYRRAQWPTTKNSESLLGRRCFESYRPVAEWMSATKPNVLVTFFNDNASSFFFDLYSTFTIGIGEQFEIADEGRGKRPLPPIRGKSRALDSSCGAVGE